MGPLLYFLTGLAALFAAGRISRLTRASAIALLLLPLCLTGRALLTGGVYGPIDLAFSGEPLISIAEKAGIRDVTNPAISDVYTEFMPWNDALRRVIRSGHWPLWNPYELCGTPLAGAAQVAPYHPVTIVGLLVPLHAYFGFAASLMFFSAALSAYLFLRDLVDSELAALSGAAAWMMSTHLVFFAGTALSHAFAITPLVLLGGRRIVREPGVRSAAILTVALLLVVLAGHPETALHVVSFGVAYTLYEMFATRSFSRTIVAGLGAGAIALLLSAFFLLPHIEVIRQSEEFVHRALGYHSRHPVSTPAQLVHRLSASFFPLLEGTPGREELPHAPSVKHGWIANAYGGTLLIALAVAGMFRTTLRERWFFIVAGLFTLAAGVAAPGVAQLLELIPGFNIAINDRMIAFATLSMCVLAAGAIDEWIASGRRTPAAVMLWLAVTYVFVAFLAGAIPLDYRVVTTARAALPLILGGIALLFLPRRVAAVSLLALLLVQRAGETDGLQPTFPARAFYPPFPGVELMRSADPSRMVALGTLLPPALSTHYGLEDVRGFQAVTFARYDDTYPLWSVRQPVWSNRVDNLSPPFISLMNVRYALIPHAVAIPAWWVRRGEYQSYDVVENTRVLPRVFIPRNVSLVRGAKESLEGIKRTTDFAEESWIESASERRRVNGRGTVTIRGNRIHAEMTSAGYVVVTNTAWSGWRARSAGREVPLLIANHAFLALELPAGSHDVELFYRPRSFVVGSWISGLSALLLALTLRFRARP